MYALVWLGTSFIATSLVFILIDTQYYSSQMNDEPAYKNYGDILRYIAPLNSFIYNSKSTNLAEHGLHPRVTHSLVNMPMLYGPLALFWYGSIIQLTSKKNNNKSPKSSMIDIKCHWTIFSGLAVLSCAPHQEPRFILPCILPVVLLCGKSALDVHSDRTRGKATILMAPWIVFNIILYIFFGWIHQGGLVDTLLVHTSNTSNNQLMPSVHIFYKTYMPPSFLAKKAADFSDHIQCHDYLTTGEGDISAKDELQQCMAVYSQPNQLVLDLQGNDSLVLLDTLQNHLPCQETEKKSSTSIHLIMPLSVANSLVVQQKSESKVGEIIWQGYIMDKNYSSRHIHLSTEDWPIWDGSFFGFIDHLQLVVYGVSCREDANDIQLI